MEEVVAKIRKNHPKAIIRFEYDYLRIYGGCDHRRKPEIKQKKISDFKRSTSINDIVNTLVFLFLDLKVSSKPYFSVIERYEYHF